MTARSGRLLLIGYGNPGRLDDGLGQRLAEVVAGREIPGVTVLTEYQLQLEHAAEIAAHDVVVFADAAVRGPAPFDFRRLAPDPAASFSTHSVSPSALLALAEEHFGARARGYALAIRGYDFNDYDERLSARAQSNLEAAFEFLMPLLSGGGLAGSVLADNATVTVPSTTSGGS